MSLDLYQNETLDRLSTLPGVRDVEPSIWDGFVRGTGQYAMRGFAQTARAIDLLGAVGPIAEDAFTGGTEAQDRYFKEHDDVFQSAVDYWTPRPNEVGVAGQVVGSLASMLPTVMLSPSLAVASSQLSTGEELVRKGVEPARAQVVGGLQAAGLGLGIYMPIFGRTLTERVLAGGIGFNVLQGIGMRGAGEVLLTGTPAEGEYKAFDPGQITLDVLLGAAFGAFAHISPAQRAESAAMWDRLTGWAKNLRPSEVDAIATLRQAQHLNVDSLPGRPAGPEDLSAHVERVRTAIDQLLRNEPVEVSNLPAGRFEPDPELAPANQRRFEQLQAEAERIRVEEGLPHLESRIASQIEATGVHTSEEAGVLDRMLGGEGLGKMIEIPRAEKLTPEQRVVETRARTQVQRDVDANIKAYDMLPDTHGGKILNVDSARELFPDYRSARYLHSPSVHEPASALIKELYARRLAEPDPLGLNIVTFTAGGTGAGKTTAISAVPLASKIVENSQITYDTNLSAFKSSAQKIDLALEHGKRAVIMYVATDPVEALKRALKRAMRVGRTVPIEEHAKTHQGSADTVQRLMEHYKGNDQVQFVILDNGSGEKGDVRIIPPKDAPEFIKTLDFENLGPRLKETLDAEFKAGNITEDIYRGTAHVVDEGDRGAVRTGGAEEPQAGARGGEQGRGAAEGVEPDPLARAADTFVAEHPDLELTVGKNADGTPITQRADDMLAQAREARARAEEDANLVRAAAQCLLEAA